MDGLKKDISAVLIPSKDGIQSRHFASEFEELIGVAINPRTYGFNSVHELIRSIPDVVKITNIGPSLFLYKAKETESTSHLTQLINKQKAKRKRGGNKGGRGGYRGGGGGGRGGGGNSFGRQLNQRPPRLQNNFNNVNNNKNRPAYPAKPAPTRTNFQNHRPPCASQRDNFNDRAVCINGPPSHGDRESAKLRLGPLFPNQDTDCNRVESKVSSSNSRPLRGATNQQSNRNDHIQPLMSLSDRFSNLEVSPYSISNDVQPSAVPQPLCAMTSGRDLDEKLDSHMETKPSTKTRRVRTATRGRGGMTAKALTSQGWDDDEGSGRKATTFSQTSPQSATNTQEQRATIQFQTKAEPQLLSDEKIPANICLLSLSLQPSLSEYQKSSFELVHFESPDSFYLQRVDGINDALQEVDQLCKKIFNLMGDSLEKYWMTEQKSRVMNDEYVVLRNSSSGIWTRAQIRQGKQYLVDYGRYSERFENCLRMPQKLSNIPAQAYHCKLDVFPLKNVWSCEACELFLSLTQNSLLYIQTKPLLQSDGINSVELITDEDDNIGDAMCETGCARKEQMTRRVRQSGAKPSYQRLVWDDLNRVRIACFETVSFVFVTLTSMESQMEILNEEIQDAVTSDSRAAIREPKQGEHYICRDSDSEYTRVRIVAIDQNTVLVEYVDFGEVSVLPTDSTLFPMKTSFFELPFQAIKVELKEFKHVNSTDENKQLMASQMLHREWYLEIVEDAQPKDKIPEVELISLEGDPLTPAEVFAKPEIPDKPDVNNNYIEVLEQKINNDEDYVTDIRNFVSCPEKGQFYIAFHPTLKKYCRAKFENEIDDQFLLNFIDYHSTFHRFVSSYIIDGSKFFQEYINRS